MKRVVRFILLGLIAIGLIVLLAGCARLEAGTVYQKNFYPAHTTCTVMPIVHHVGKTTFVTNVPRTHHHPDRYEICIKGKLDGEDATAAYDVSKDIYDEFEIGDFISFAD